MKSNIRVSFFLLALNLIACGTTDAAERSGLILTKEGLADIHAGLGTVPLFDSTLDLLQQEVDSEIELGIDTPIPRDLSGGYTHQKHKANFFSLQKAGVLFQILEEDKYAEYVRDMLFQYEAMYKNLPLHPQTRSYARGKLFWQCLNDANWLLYAAQAYDSIHDWLSEEERNLLESNLFRPFADHISIDSPQFFNRVHNHSTWGAAAVGMIGLVMEDEELINRALYGLDDDDLEIGAKDDDGGFIKVEGQDAGFFANLNEPFSPDGYYTEGPYYQRYAMYPFLVFAQALNNARPDLGVLQFKDGVLLKAVDTLLNLSDTNGEFFPINDGQKGMSYHSYELVTAVNIAYHFGNQDPRLLSIAQEQGKVLLDDAGYAVALGIRDGLSKDFTKSSANYSDGANGDQGGLGLLRYGDEELTLVYKYSAQGLSHGHYDKLSFSLYENGDEVMQDYGLARFVNIEQKGGGNYLPENTTWAKQTIAHNTLVQNETSHFNGLYEVGSQHHSNLRFFDDSDENVQVISANELNAYPSSALQRTMVMIKDEEFEKPFLLDLFKVSSETQNQYDLPYYYLGQILKSNFNFETHKELEALGEKNGYQHLYLEATGALDSSNAKFSWMAEDKFYTLTTVADADDQVLLARIGANDPEFNLRKDPTIILRRADTRDTLFASVIEPHGSYNRVTESAVNSNSNIAELSVLQDDQNYTAVQITTTQGSNRVFIVSNVEVDVSTTHSVNINGEVYSWTGPSHYFSSAN